MKKLSQIPEPLQKQVLARLGLGALAVLLFALLLYMTREFYSTIPCIALAVFCGVNAWLLYRRALAMDYVLLQGVCRGVELTPIRKYTRAIELEAQPHTVRVMIKQRFKKISVGARVELYIAKTATVEERDGMLILHQYLALEVSQKKSVADD